MYCRKCGQNISDDSSFCALCGTQVVAPSTAPQSCTVPADVPDAGRRKIRGIVVGALILIAVVAVVAFLLLQNGEHSVRPDIVNEQLYTQGMDYVEGCWSDEMEGTVVNELMPALLVGETDVAYLMTYTTLYKKIISGIENLAKLSQTQEEESFVYAALATATAAKMFHTASAMEQFYQTYPALAKQSFGQISAQDFQEHKEHCREYERRFKKAGTKEEFDAIFDDLVAENE